MSELQSSSLSNSSDRMISASPVFIVGHPRSGTSMLFSTLQRHPSFQARRVDLHESQIITRLSTAFRWADDKPRQLLGFMLDDREEYGKFLKETRALRYSTLLTAPASIPLRGRIPTPIWRSQKLHIVVRSYFAHAWTARGCARLVDKSPRSVPHLDKLRLVSPRAKMLFVSRHPVDTFASYRARVRRDPTATWADVSPFRFVRIYREGVLGAIEAVTQGNPSLLLTRYEDLTRDPAGEFRRICDFINEPYLDSCIEGHDSQRKAVASELLYGPVSANDRRWREDVDEVTAHRIETDLAEVMALAGYEPYI